MGILRSQSERTKVAFGTKANIQDALSKNIIDLYDVIYLDNGEIAWIDENSNIMYSTPRTQEAHNINGNTVGAGKSLDEIIELLLENDEATKEMIQEYESYNNFPLVGKTKTIYIDTTNNIIYRYDENDLKYYSIGNKQPEHLYDVIDGNF